MNVLLIAIGSHGDVHPFCGIGLALQSRGHNVTLAANGYFRPLIESVGLKFEQIGSAELYQSMAKNPELWSPFRSIRTVFEGGAIAILRECYDCVRRHYVPGETVVAASSLALGARVAQDEIGVPLVSVHLQPSMFRSAHAPPNLGAPPIPDWFPLWIKRKMVDSVDPLLDFIIARPLNEFRKQIGLRPVRGVLKNWIHSPTRVIGLFPDWFAPPQPDWPPQTRLTGFPLFDEVDVTPMPRELSDFLDAGDAPIAFTPGSAMWTARRFFEQSAQACAHSGRRGLLLSRHHDHLPSRLPDGVIHVEYAPFSQLLPHCAAFVHHGGVGSSAQGLAAGIPQLVMPFAHDQPDNATRLKRLGVAESISPRDYFAPRVAAALRRLISSTRIAERCAILKQRMKASHAIEQTCDLIGGTVQHPEFQLHKSNAAHASMGR